MKESETTTERPVRSRTSRIGSQFVKWSPLIIAVLALPVALLLNALFPHVSPENDASVTSLADFHASGMSLAELWAVDPFMAVMAIVATAMMTILRLSIILFPLLIVVGVIVTMRKERRELEAWNLDQTEASEEDEVETPTVSKTR